MVLTKIKEFKLNSTYITSADLKHDNLSYS